ncbi:MAG: type II toxin-antitoxin system PemK/MazF family toxin [Candidatus Andersenbacteria bacterium]|nr:type II toxin-antitoxin system PemK/MazF family toxin [Candidatus Andersenbacteria bacterium]
MCPTPSRGEIWWVRWPIHGVGHEETSKTGQRMILVVSDDRFTRNNPHRMVFGIPLTSHDYAQNGNSVCISNNPYHLVITRRDVQLPHSDSCLMLDQTRAISSHNILFATYMCRSTV